MSKYHWHAPVQSGVNSLYVAKCIAAFLVVCCHASMGPIDDFIAPISMAAVPLFFLISGYFLYSESVERSYERARRALSHVLPLVLVVNLVYYLWLLPLNGNVVNSTAKLWQLLWQGGLLSGHLWYLTALLQGLLVVALLLRLGWSWLLPYLTPLALLSLLGGHYTWLLTDVAQDYYWPVYTSWCYAIPYLALGYTLGRHRERLLRWRWEWVLLLSLPAVLVEAALLERYIGWGDGAYLLGTLLAASALLTSLRYPDLGRGSLAAWIGARYSGSIYYFHLLVVTVTARLLGSIGLDALYYWAGAPLVFVLTLVLCIPIIGLQDRLGYRILR